MTTTYPRAGRRAGAALRILPAVVALACIGAVATPNAYARAAAPASVRLTVDSISPYAPKQSHTTLPIQFVLTLTNTTSVATGQIVVTAARALPVTTQAGLGRVTLAPVSSTSDGLPIAPVSPVKTSLPADGSVQVTFSTTTSTVDGDGICQCQNAVYPILFTASSVSTGQALGTGGTYVPISEDAAPVQVAWLWPLIDRPHRLLSDAVFADDTLATEVAADGRLDHALDVVENVGSTVPLTLVIDPELIDELVVMAAGTYRVQSTHGATVAGTGADAAAAWLQRLHDVLSTDSSVSVQLTPYADPDIQSVTAHGSTWRTRMPADMAARVGRALEGKALGTDLTWPAGGRLGRRLLSTLDDRGTRSVVLDSGGVSTSTSTSAAPPGVVRVRAGSATLPALLTTTRLTGLVQSAVTAGQSGLLALPRLLAELTIRSTQDPSQPAQAVLVPPRYVNPDVAAASAVIETSSASTYTTPVSTSQLANLSGLRTTRAIGSIPSDDGLPAVVYDAVHALQRSAPAIRSLLTVRAPSGAAATRQNKAATALLGELPVAIQRTESSAWRAQDGLQPATGSTYAVRLSELVDRLRNGVHIVPPSTGSYTLASGNSDLPVTVANDLDYPVSVDVHLEAVNGVPGLEARTLESKTIPAQTKVVLHVPASIDRTVRIKVHAYLTTTSGSALGAATTLSVHSTAFGTLGVIITAVAGVLLLLALGRRWYRSASARRVRRPSTASPGRA